MRDILRFRTQENKVKIMNGAVTAFRSKDIVKTGARVFKDGRVASAARIGDVADAALWDKSLAHQGVALPADAVPSGKPALKAWKQLEAKVTGGEGARQVAESHMEALAAQLPNFIINGQVNATEREISYRNDQGTDLSLASNELFFNYDLRRKGSPNIVDGFIAQMDFWGRSPGEDLGWTIDLFRTFDREVKLKAGRHKVLMLPEETSMRKIGESLRADSYCEGSALYSQRLGEKIFSERFSLSDLRVAPERGIFQPFDYEGEVAVGAKTVLLEKGKLVSLISDLKNQKRHKVASSANGFREYNSSVRLGFAGLAVEPGIRPFREILKDSGEVIVSVMAYGGDLTAQGDFSTPVQLAFFVKNGEIQGRLPALSMSSTLERMFGNELLEVAADGPYRHSNQPYMLKEMDFQVI